MLGGTNVSKPNRIKRIIILPFVVFTFLIGWCLSWTGEKKLQIKNPASTFYSGHLRASYAHQNDVASLSQKISKQISDEIKD